MGTLCMSGYSVCVCSNVSMQLIRLRVLLSKASYGGGVSLLEGEHAP